MNAQLIRDQLTDLSAANVCMPIDIFSLSNSMKEIYPNDELQGIVDGFIYNENAFVRRAIIIALRFIGGSFARHNIGHLRTSLADDNEWVSYDAIWALSELDEMTPSDREAIAVFAAPYSNLNPDELKDVRPDAAFEYRAKMAAEVLLKF